MILQPAIIQMKRVRTEMIFRFFHIGTLDKLKLIASMTNPNKYQ